MLPDAFGHGQHILKISASVLAHRRTYGNKSNAGRGNGLFNVCRKFQRLFFVVPEHQLFQARLIDRNVPLLQRLYLFCININTDDAVSHLRETCPGDESDVACAYY